jgi:hypothetical protein
MSDTVFILLFMLTLTLALFRGVRNLRVFELMGGVSSHAAHQEKANTTSGR